MDIDTGLVLSGFEGGRSKLSITEKVRLRGLVQSSRLAVVEVAGRGGDINEIDNGARSQLPTDDEYPTDDDTDAMRDEEVDGVSAGWEMEIARIYERTLVELGATLNPSGAE